MRKRLLFLLCSLSVIAFVGSVAADNAKLTLSLNPPTIRVGESSVATVSIASKDRVRPRPISFTLSSLGIATISPTDCMLGKDFNGCSVTVYGKAIGSTEIVAHATGYLDTPSQQLHVTSPVIYSFKSWEDGAYPVGSLIQGKDGYLYGTTELGGTSNIGTVFKISTAGDWYRSISFMGQPDGAFPYASLIQGKDGYLYGTTGRGGTYNYGNGTVFKISTAGEKYILYSFTGQLDGAFPYASLIQGTDGHLYGTTRYSGRYDGGTVFKISTDGAISPCYSFAIGEIGHMGFSAAGLIQGKDGYLYGITSEGGLYDSGAIIKLPTSLCH